MIGVYIRSAAAAAPMADTVPGHTGVGGFPYIHTADVNLACVGGIYRLCQIIPTLAPGIIPEIRPAQEIGRTGLLGPITAAVRAAV